MTEPKRRLILRLTVAFSILGNGQSSGIADEPLKETDLTDNVKVRLVAARRGETRTVPLIAKFVTLDKEKREILVQFPSHASYVATPHERTLMNLVEAGVGGCGPGSGPEWTKAEVQVVFSIPKGGVDGLNRKDYEKCYLVSLKLKNQ
jgi:hypothetical protein